jgi:hypothetical protein
LHPVQSAFLERDGLQCGYVEVVDQVASSAEEEDIDAEWLDEEDTGHPDGLAGDRRVSPVAQSSGQPMG